MPVKFRLKYLQEADVVENCMNDNNANNNKLQIIMEIIIIIIMVEINNGIPGPLNDPPLVLHPAREHNLFTHPSILQQNFLCK